MKIAPWLGAVLALAFAVSDVLAGPFGLGSRGELDRVNQHLNGQIVDYTHNHGVDHRMWSESLHERRDLYVYLPPGYDPTKLYPLVIWLHAFRQDEQAFLTEVAGVFDKAITCGQLPPFVIAVPDGTIDGHRTFVMAGSFFINSKAGNFENYVVCDVYNFVRQHYLIRPEPEAHALLGASMGGYAAYTLAFKHPDQFKIAVGLFPPLNLRWVDCHDHYRRPFDPDCWGWRDRVKPCEVIARFYGIPIRMGQMTHAVLDNHDPNAIERMAEENPIELLDSLDIRPGQFELYIAYAGKDEFNIAAQVESFLYVARQRCLEIGVGYDPKGHHDLATGLKLFPGIAAWLAPRLAPYAP